MGRTHTSNRKKRRRFLCASVFLASRENDGLGAVLDEVAEGGGGVGHGVCTIYSVGHSLKTDLGVLEAYDMTTEALTAKLMWALGQTGAS